MQSNLLERHHSLSAISNTLTTNQIQMDATLGGISDEIRNPHQDRPNQFERNPDACRNKELRVLAPADFAQHDTLFLEPRMKTPHN